MGDFGVFPFLLALQQCEDEADLTKLLLLQEARRIDMMRRLTEILSHSPDALLLASEPSPRRHHIVPRANNFAQDMEFWMREDPALADVQLRKVCHVSLDSFKYLLRKVAPMLERQLPGESRAVRADVVPPLVMLMGFLEHCAHDFGYGALENVYGVAANTWSKNGDRPGIIREVLAALRTLLLDGINHSHGPEISFDPHPDSIRRHCAEFQQLFGLQGCCGALDSTLVQVQRPTQDHAADAGTAPEDYQVYGSKEQYALKILAAVDARGRYTWLDAGAPGSLADADAWSRSGLRAACRQGGGTALDSVRIDLGPGTSDSVPPAHPDHATSTAVSSRVPYVDQGSSSLLNSMVPGQGSSAPASVTPDLGSTAATHSITPYFVTDAGFPLTDDLMKPFEDPRPGSPEEALNYLLVRAWRLVGDTIGRTKAKWKVLYHNRSVRDPSHMAELVRVLCALYNYLARHEGVESFHELDEAGPNWRRDAGILVPPNYRPAETHADYGEQEAVRSALLKRRTLTPAAREYCVREGLYGPSPRLEWDVDYNVPLRADGQPVPVSR